MASARMQRAARLCGAPIGRFGGVGFPVIGADPDVGPSAGPGAGPGPVETALIRDIKGSISALMLVARGIQEGDYVFQRAEL
eukprot:605383-Hanusia_phi.AAC.4